MEKYFEKIEKYILFAVIFLLPIIVLSVSSNPFIVSKLAILTFALILLFVLMGIKTILTGKLSFPTSVYDLPLAVIAIAYLLSIILRSPNKMEALLLPGTGTAILGGIFLYFFINLLKEKDKSTLVKVLGVSGAVFSLFIVLAFSGAFAKIPQLPAYLKAQTFTPEGGYLPSFIFLLTLIPAVIGTILSEKEAKIKTAFIGVLVFIIIGVGISVYQIFPGKPLSPRLPGFAASWSIAIDSLKQSPLLGVGPGNYLTAFNRYRPLAFNAKDIWALKFSTAQDYYLTLFTETGLLGLAGMALLLYQIVKTSKQDIKEKKLVNWGFAGIANFISLVVILLALFVFPASPLLLIFLFVFLSFATKAHITVVNLTTSQVKEEEGPISISKFPALLISLPILVLALFVGYRASRIVLAEFYYTKSLEALLQNQVQPMLNYMQSAERLNLRVDRYRATASRVDLILADALVRKATTPDASGKAPQVTDQDRTAISQLIQAAIAEAKANVALNPLRAGNWELLGRTYQSIIPLAKGADSFAIQSYQQAVLLDPINPNYRIALGGLYYQAKNYETAARVFELAVSTKPDVANSHYNLALAYRELGKVDDAKNQMALVLSLVTPNTKDYDLAKQTLSEIENKIKELSQTQGENLTPPQGQEQVIKPPLELPEGSQPPETPITTPTPQPEASPSPTTNP
jgi:tetratricopeptide (TPR) repeat protein